MVAASDYVAVLHTVVDGSLYNLVPLVQDLSIHIRIQYTHSVLDFHVVLAVYNHQSRSTNRYYSLSHMVRGDLVTWLLRAALVTAAVVRCDRR